MDTRAPSFAEASRFWIKLGFINFGGPTGQIAIMHDEIVERRAWLDESRFLHALSFCVLLPGPEAQQLAIYIGWLLHGTAGGIVAGSFFVLPAAVLIGALAYLYAAHAELWWVAGILDGLAAAVVGIVVAATITIAKRALRAGAAWVIAAVVFIAIFIVGLPFPFIVAGAGAAGVVLGPARLGVASSDHAGETVAARPRTSTMLRVLAVGLAVWWLPLLAVAAVAGVESLYARQAFFFSQVAVISFGGAYAVLTYVGREVAGRFGLFPRDVVAGLGLAETTPGPLILVVEFLAFVAAYRNPGELHPVVAGSIGAAVTVWATFAPSFLWIFLGAPWVERLRANERLRGALAAITAAAVGVIASLGVTLAAGVMFDVVRSVRPFAVEIVVPVLGSVDPFHLAVASAALVATWRFRVHIVAIVATSAAAGLLWAAVR